MNGSDDFEHGESVKDKMNQLLMLADDPKRYQLAMEELKKEEGDKGNFSQDHLFDDRYIISERNF